MAKRWKPQEITYLKRYSKSRLVNELAKRFKTKPEEVEAKLKELILTSKDGKGAKPLRRDPLVDEFERGLEALNQGKYGAAKKHFTLVVNQTGQIDLSGRAKRYLQVCESKVAKKKRPVAEDPFLQAVYERNCGNLEEALAICSRGGRQSKDERFTYLTASIYAVMDDTANAVKYLELAIDLNPKNRIHAFHDTDFEVLRSDPELRQLFF
jgi:tetratricopeptide (TPR) repeat protein